MMMHISLNFKDKITQFTLSLILTACLLVYPYRGAWAQNMPPLIRDIEIEATMKMWADPLLKASGIPNVNIILVQSNDLNAFVAGGSNIFFYTGLLMKTDGPEEVMGVMAHEMGHISGGHLVKMRGAAERATYESILGAVLGVGAAMAGGGGDAANALILGSSSMAQRRFLTHSRVHESSADQAALSFMQSAKLNPSGLSRFFGKLESQELLPPSQQSEYVRTHPITRERIESADSRIAQSPYKDKAYPPDWIEAHARMKAKLIGFINPGQVDWQYDGSDKSIAAQYARAIAAYRLNDVQSALSQMDALIAAEPNNPYFYELKGQILKESGKVSESIIPYRKATDLLPGAPLIQIDLAHALIESSNDPAALNEAITYLKRAEKKEQRSSRIHRLLATAYGRLGQESMAKLELAEEALLQRKYEYGRSQVQGALAQVKQGSPEWIKGNDILAQIDRLEAEED